MRFPELFLAFLMKSLNIISNKNEFGTKTNESKTHLTVCV